MTITTVDLKTKKIKVREWTEDELKAHEKWIILDAPTPTELALERLNETDKDMARLAEDVIATLINKGIVKLSDFPAIVVEKLTERKKLREKLEG